MSATFIIALIAALLAIMYWRIVLMIVCALLLAMLVTGISTVSDVIAGQEQPPTIVAPAQPDPRQDGEAADPDGTGEAREGDPRAHEQPPR